jgi:hypothetical protein
VTDEMDHELEGRIGDLYTFPPEGFTASRNELGDALRAEGRREDEKRVRALRRPSVMAWAINVAVRSHRELAEELLEAGRALRAEQQRALSGPAAEGLREAAERRRQIVLRLRDAAAEVLRSADRDPRGSLDELAGTFEAASVDEEAGDLLLAARLERTLTPPAGLGDTSGLRLVTRKGDRRKPQDDDEEGETRPQDVKTERKRQRGQLARAFAEASKRQRAADSQVEKLREKMERARSSLDDATHALRTAEAEARGAKLDAARAAAALERAERKGQFGPGDV